MSTRLAPHNSDYRHQKANSHLYESEQRKNNDNQYPRRRMHRKFQEGNRTGDEYPDEPTETDDTRQRTICRMVNEELKHHEGNLS